LILANVEEIIEVKRLGVIDGVTTNPTHVAKTGRHTRSFTGKSATWWMVR